jgi:Domain of unknown function (DUF4296)
MRPVIIFCLLCFLVSCGSPKKELLSGRLSADSVIPRDKMIRILVDVHLVEASLNLKRDRGGNVSFLTQNYYQWLYRKYHMSHQRFRDNLNYYKTDTENFSKMYDEVVKNLNDLSKKTGVPGKK